MIYSIAIRCSANFRYYGEQPATLQITINYTGTLTNDCTYYTNTNDYGVCLYKASDLTIQGSSFTLTPDNSEIAPVSGSLGNGYQPPRYDYWEFAYPYSLFSAVANVSTTDVNKYSDVNNYFLNPPEPTGEGSATVEIDYDGENLTFESAHYESSVTQFIDDDATIDMRPV